MEINLSRLVVSNIYKCVCLVYMHSIYITVYFMLHAFTFIHHKNVPEEARGANRSICPPWVGGSIKLAMVWKKSMNSGESRLSTSTVEP